jgi:glutamate--cysteine ligase
MLPLAVQAAMAAIEKICPEAATCWSSRKTTRATLSTWPIWRSCKRIFHMAGLNVRIGSIRTDIKPPPSSCPRRKQITLEPVLRSKRRLGLKDFDPCTILLNNDLSAGVPGILEDLHEQYLLPPLHAGWSVRRKSPLQELRRGGQALRQAAGHRPLADQPDVQQVRRGRPGPPTQGWSACSANVDALLTKIRRKYKEYGINEKPFVVVKADNGTTAWAS